MLQVLLLVVSALSAEEATDAQPTDTSANEEVVAQRELASHFYPTHRGETVVRDGSVAEEWNGPGRTQFRLARRFLDKRRQLVEQAEGAVETLMKLVNDSRAATTDQAKADIKDQLKVAVGDPVDQAERSMLESIDAERQRLRLIRKAVIISQETESGQKPDIDLALVEQNLKTIQDGEMAEHVKRRFSAYRRLANSLIAYLDGDIIDAIEILREAEKEAPDIEQVHVFLGSFYYLARQPKQAVVHWKKALEINPDNQELREAIDAFSEL